jgi:hypothetical protein
MNLLSHHGTVLRADKTGQWIHTVLWPPDEAFTDVELDVPQAGLSAPCMTGDVVIEPAAVPGLVCLHRDEVFLSADARKARLDFERASQGEAERFLPVTRAVLARLRLLAGSVVRIGENGETGAATLEDGFVLRVAGRDFGLLGAALAGARGLVVGGATLLAGAARPLPARVALRPRTLGLARAVDAGLFAKGPGKSLSLGGSEELAFPPSTVSDADQIWMQRNAWSPAGQSWGRVGTHAAIQRTQNAFVLMSRGHEGTIFDETGLFTNPGYLLHIPVKGAGHFSRGGDVVCVDAEALRDAPFLAGPHVVFYGGQLSNYFHWMIEGLVPLHVLAPLLPPATRLLLPGSLAAMRDGPEAAWLPDHQAMLEAWGFGAMARSVVEAPICRVEDVYWLEDPGLDVLQAARLQGARQRAMAGVRTGQAGRRIYIRRPGLRSVRNAAEVEAFLSRAGFETVGMGGMAHTAQMALFDAASFVIGPHGAELSNLMFCRPGARVIELSPAAQFRPFFAQISDKSGLSHAVLPCATDDGGFNGRMTVELDRLARLIDLMLARAA